MKDGRLESKQLRTIINPLKQFMQQYPGPLVILYEINHVKVAVCEDWREHDDGRGGRGREGVSESRDQSKATGRGMLLYGTVINSLKQFMQQLPGSFTHNEDNLSI